MSSTFLYNRLINSHCRIGFYFSQMSYVIFCVKFIWYTGTSKEISGFQEKRVNDQSHLQLQGTFASTLIP